MQTKSGYYLLNKLGTIVTLRVKMFHVFSALIFSTIQRHARARQNILRWNAQRGSFFKWFFLMHQGGAGLRQIQALCLSNASFMISASIDTESYRVRNLKQPLTQELKNDVWKLQLVHAEKERFICSEYSLSATKLIWKLSVEERFKIYRPDDIS